MRILACVVLVLLTFTARTGQAGLRLDAQQGYLRERGLDVLAFNNLYDGAFSDAKIAGVELIHHGVRTATNGDVRLSPTPGQWDPVPELRSRQIDARTGTVTVQLAYPDEDFAYAVKVQARGSDAVIRVMLDKPLPASLAGRAGFNLEFLPAAYFGKAWMMDASTGALPRYPSGPTERDAFGAPQRLPIARGRHLVLAPEDPARRVAIDASGGGELALYDGRNEAQNGWYVVRTLLPGDRTGTVLEWTLHANVLADWTRPTSIAHSQLGYTPAQRKVAVLERDRNAQAPGRARLLRIAADGSEHEALAAVPADWGDWLRYHYCTFDFSAVREPGLYAIEADGVRSAPFRIAADVHAGAWHPTLDVYLAQQMDHMSVREAYAVWHGRSHMDDARQVAENQTHFDLYQEGPSNDSPFQPGEHIPGLDVGGWFDAGDYDLRTQTHYSVVQSLVATWERFRPMRDETRIDQQRREVEMHHPDGVPDLLQQIEQGTLMLIAQQRVFGHAIPGIIEPDLQQYRHLGDASTKTDGRVDDPADPASAHDDRLAFTTATTALNYGSAAALAAASRALRGYRDALAEESLVAARRVWDFEHGRKPNLYHYGNTTGGDPADEELKAAVQLLLATHEAQYARRIAELWPAIDAHFAINAHFAVQALPEMDAGFAAKLRQRALAWKAQRKAVLAENPFGVEITRRGWAGNGTILNAAVTSYWLHTAWPDLFGTEDTLQGLDYLYGTHPDSSISFVSGVGTHSKSVAYGNNRANFTFIAGGVVPGILVLNPDFPENKEDWPFLWGENEYVVDTAVDYMFLANAAQHLTRAD